jgi:hypothetical protein
VKLSRCRSCGEPIVWTITTNGKRMPVDAEPVVAPRGFRIDEDVLDEAQQGFNDDDLRPGKELIARFAPVPDVGERLYQSHFSACPQGANWRNS